MVAAVADHGHHQVAMVVAVGMWTKGGHGSQVLCAWVPCGHPCFRRWAALWFPVANFEQLVIVMMAAYANEARPGWCKRRGNVVKMLVMVSKMGHSYDSGSGVWGGISLRHSENSQLESPAACQVPRVSMCSA